MKAAAGQTGMHAAQAQITRTHPSLQSYGGYHGYWPVNLYDVNRGFGSADDLQRVLQELSNAGEGPCFGVRSTHASRVAELRSCSAICYSYPASLASRRPGQGVLGHQPAPVTALRLAASLGFAPAPSRL